MRDGTALKRRHGWLNDDFPHGLMLLKEWALFSRNVQGNSQRIRTCVREGATQCGQGFVRFAWWAPVHKWRPHREENHRL